MQFASVTLGQTVLHQVSGRNSPGPGLVLSDVASELIQGQREYIQGRIRRALAQFARPIVEGTDETSVPTSARAILEDATSLVPESQAIARHLQRTQPGISPGGIVVVAAATFEGRNALILAKLEHELGVRAQQTVLEDGSKTFDVQLLHDLLFTEGSRVFKVALLTQGNAANPQLGGYLVDNQAAGFGVAQYFLSDFLGFQLAERADRLTEKFHEATENWLNHIPDPKTRGEYAIALISELQSPQTSISPNDFAMRHLQLEDRDDFLGSLASEGVPSSPFQKDTTLIANRLSQVRIDTQSGIIVSAPPSAYENGLLTVEQSAENGATITVRDQIKQMSGRGRRHRDRGQQDE